MALYKFSIDLSQNLKPEPSPIKTLSDIINGQAQQSLNRDVSIVCHPLGRWVVKFKGDELGKDVSPGQQGEFCVG